MEFALPTVAVALVLVVLLGVLRRARRPATTPAQAVETPFPIARVVLDVGDADPGSESVRRLVEEAASRVSAGAREVTEVEVVGRTGKLLGRVATVHPAPRAVDFPPVTQLEPHVVVRRTSEPPVGLEGEIHATVTPRFEARERPAPERPLAESFDLPEAVRTRIRRPNDPIDIVRAILESAGLPVEMSGDVLRSADRVVVVLPASHRSAHDALNHAYLRFRQTGVASGIVVALGFLPPTEVERREMLAPHLKHAGTAAIQRMADAVALGADPLDFALGPPILVGGPAPGAETSAPVDARDRADRS